MSDILLNSGRLLSYRSPIPSAIHINDIAHSLSMQCRFNGHCHQFYSVAQHCVYCAEQIKNGANYRSQMHALLHDAHEAYVGDLNDNFKKYLNIEGCLSITILDRLIYTKFIGSVPPEEQIERVNVVDKRMFLTEMRDLMPPCELIFFDGQLRPFDITIEPWGIKEAKARFLAKFKELEALI